MPPERRKETKTDVDDTTHGTGGGTGRRSRRKVRSQGRRPPELPRAPSRKVKAEVVARRGGQSNVGAPAHYVALLYAAAPCAAAAARAGGPVNGPLPGARRASPLPPSGPVRARLHGAPPWRRRRTGAPSLPHPVPLPTREGGPGGGCSLRPRATAWPPHLRPRLPAIPLFPVHS